jgi:hypothetical protein
MKVGLEWILVLMLCTTLVASGLLYFLFIVTTRGRVALIALVVVVPPAPGASSGVRLTTTVSPWCSDLEGGLRVEDTGCCLSSCTSAHWVRYCSLCI